MSDDNNVSTPIVGRLDIQLLRSLIAVAEAPTISAAAKNLHLTQPTLSLQLKRLEERSGRVLFEPSRQGRTRRLTAHGLRLVGYAKRIISAYDEAVLYLEVAKRIADILEVSLDFLTGQISSEIDKSIVDTVMTIQNLPADERERILFTIDALVRDAKSRFAYA